MAITPAEILKNLQFDSKSHKTLTMHPNPWKQVSKPSAQNWGRHHYQTRAGSPREKSDQAEKYSSESDLRAT